MSWDARAPGLHGWFDSDAPSALVQTRRLWPAKNGALAQVAGLQLFVSGASRLLQPAADSLPSCIRYRNDGASCSCTAEHIIRVHEIDSHSRPAAEGWTTGFPHAYCEGTSDGPAVCASGIGSWPLSEGEKLNATEACLSRCARCAACEYISVSSAFRDCSYYSRAHCSLGRLHRDDMGAGHVTIAVSPAAVEEEARLLQGQPSVTALRLLAQVLPSDAARVCTDELNFRARGGEDARVLSLAPGLGMLLYSEHRSRGSFARDGDAGGGSAHPNHRRQPSSQRGLVSQMIRVDPLGRLDLSEPVWLHAAADGAVRLHATAGEGVDASVDAGGGASAAAAGRPARVEKNWSPFALGGTFDGTVVSHQWLCCPATIVLRHNLSSGRLLERFESRAGAPGRFHRLLGAANATVVSGGTPAVRLNRTHYVAIGHTALATCAHPGRCKDPWKQVTRTQPTGTAGAAHATPARRSPWPRAG